VGLPFSSRIITRSRPIAQFAAVYSLDRKALSELKKELSKIEGDKILYCFTLDPLGLNKKDFSEWKNVTVEPIPQKILDVYKQIYEY
jgi:hypothetical protein